MKRFNKILALVLAMTMMFCVVSICASAADTENAAYKVRFVDNDGNPITSVEAGSTANVIVSIKTNGYSNNFTFQGFFDSNKLSHIRQNGSAVQSLSAKNCGKLLGRFENTGEWADAPDDLIKHEYDEIGNGYVLDWGYTNNVVMAPHSEGMYPPDFTDAMKAQYKGVYLIYTANSGDSCVKVNTYNEFIDIVRFRFLANETTDLDKTVFFLSEHPSFTNIYIDPMDEPLSNVQGQVNPIKVSNLAIEYPGGGSTPATVKVNTLDAQVQWADKEKGLLNIGFRGQIAEGYDHTKDLAGGTGPNGGLQLNTLTEVGFILTSERDGVTNTPYPAYTIYNFKDGGYFYRLVVGNVPYTSDEDFSVQAYVVIGGKTYNASNTITTTGKAQYDRAVKIEGFGSK